MKKKGNSKKQHTIVKKEKINFINEKIDVVKNKIKEKTKGIYLGYGARVILSVLSFSVLFSISLLFFTKTINVEEEKVVRYQETGALDYKVYLKPNEFYESPYLDKNMNYIASLIKNISIDLSYQFIMDYPSDMNFTYDVIGKLAITSSSGQSKLYEKEYVLKSSESKSVSGNNIYNFKDNLIVDYDYYNAVANKFKSTYGVDATSDFTIYVRVNKKVKNEEHSVDLNESKQMSLTIPLTQKTLTIQLNNTGINNSNSIVQESKVSLGNIVFGIFCLITFVSSVASLLKFLELIIILQPKTSKYDKYIKKILNEYDRLIVETPTEPRFTDKDIIKITRFEELLDARDNLKRPIMYHNLVKNQKCYFYIEKDSTMYLLTIKAADLEG